MPSNEIRQRAEINRSMLVDDLQKRSTFLATICTFQILYSDLKYVALNHRVFT